MQRLEETLEQGKYKRILDNMTLAEKTSADFSYFKNKSIYITGLNAPLISELANLLLLRNDLYSDGIKVILDTKLENVGNRSDVLVLPSDELLSEKFDFVVCFLRDNQDEYKDIPYCLEQDKISVVNALNLAKSSGAGLLLLSSIDIFGFVHTAEGRIFENSVGYISTQKCENPVGASQRFCKSLAYSFARDNGVFAVFGVLPYVYGEISQSSYLSKVLNQFKSSDSIIPKFADEKMSIGYISDVLGAILFLLKNGVALETYNIAFETDTLTLREIKTLVYKALVREPKCCGAEESSYMVSNTVLDGSKLLNLGFKSDVEPFDGIKRVLEK